MAAIRGHFRRGTDCFQLAMHQVSCFYHKMHDSSQNCYISAPLLSVFGTETIVYNNGSIDISDTF